MSAPDRDPERSADHLGGPAVWARLDDDPRSREPVPPTPPAWPYAWQPPEPVREPRRAGRALAVGAAVAMAVAALGAPLGLLWAQVAPQVPVRMTEDGAILADQQPEQFVAGDGWFAILGLGLGLLAALAVWFVARRQRGPVGLVVVTLGAVGAGLLAWWVGRHIGLAEYQRLLEQAPVGSNFGKPADLRARGSFLVPAFVAAAAYTLLAGWSRHPSLHREAEREPGREADRAVERAGGPSAAGSGAVSWGLPAPPAPTAAPAPPAPGSAAPPPG